MHSPAFLDKMRLSSEAFGRLRYEVLRSRRNAMRVALISVLLAGAGAVLAATGWTAPGVPPKLADNSPDAVPVDVELVLAVDVSYSMDPEEQALQREGYITGITSRDFMQALRGGQH